MSNTYYETLIDYNDASTKYNEAEAVTTTTKKQYLYKLYSDSSSKWDEMIWDVNAWGGGSSEQLVTVWRNDVLSSPSFRTVINGGDGEMVVKLARPFDNFGEGIDIVLGLTVKLFVYDRENPQGLLIFKGFISGYSPTLEGETEFVLVRVRGFGVTLSDRILKDGSGNTTITYTNEDPSFIFKDVLNKFVDDGGELGFTASDVENTNTTVTYTFNTNTYREALDKVVELSPEGWYWRINPSGDMAFKVKSNQTQNQISTRKDVMSFIAEKNIEDFYNEVYFVGGDTGGGENLYIKKSTALSIDAYGRKVKKLVDGRLSDQDSATTIATRFLNEKSTPARRTVVKVLDSNGEYGKGYDIETLKVGDTIEVSELTAAIPAPSIWDIFQWDANVWDNLSQNDPRDIMQITSITYNADFAEIEATTRLPEISRRVEVVDKKLESTVMVSNPSVPTSV